MYMTVTGQDTRVCVCVRECAKCISVVQNGVIPLKAVANT